MRNESLAEMSEKTLTTLVVGPKRTPGVARQLGWEAYHTLRSKGSEPGFPDWVLARDRVVYLELKTEKGPVSDAQRHWIGKLLGANAEVYIVRPRYLNQITWVLARRQRPRPGDNPHGDGLLDELRSVLAE